MYKIIDDAISKMKKFNAQTKSSVLISTAFVLVFIFIINFSIPGGYKKFAWYC
jgi:hypothetical protein